MGIIRDIARALTQAIGFKTGPRLTGLNKSLSALTQWGMKKLGYSQRDVVDTIVHAGVEAIADKLNQSVFTVSRLLSTESSVMTWDKTKLLPRNLIVSGNLKSGRNYRFFYQADMFDSRGKFIDRKWFSYYSDTQKSFQELEEDIIEQVSSGNYETSFTIANITFHHVMHQRGASFIPVRPR